MRIEVEISPEPEDGYAAGRLVQIAGEEMMENAKEGALKGEFAAVVRRQTNPAVKYTVKWGILA
jgi:hypothetical protein